MKRLHLLQKEKSVIFFVILSIFLCVFPVFSQKTPVQPTQTNQSLSAREIASKILPSTVMIVTQDENGETVAQGSGFVFKPGLIATNLHVFNRATKAYVKFVGKDTTYNIEEVVGLNPRRDLCVIRINDTQIKPPSISNSTRNEVGDDIFVASNPKGLEGSFSKGIISAVRKNVGLIQIDAAISPGSSGGAVLNNRGEVVGMVVSSVTTGQNLNFAIPIEYLTSIKLEYNELVTSAGALAFNGRQREKLKGLVESIEETKADYIYNDDARRWVEQSASLQKKMGFDIHGNVLFNGEYSSEYEGKIQMRTIREYTYDDNGFMRQKITEDYDYNSLDYNPPQESNKKNTKNFSVLESIKEANWQRSFSQSRNSVDYGNVVTKEVFDNKGNLLESRIFLPNIQINLSRVVYSYGDNGFISKQESYLTNVFDELGLVQVLKFTYEVDKLGNWIKKFTTRMNPSYSESGFVLDSVTYRKITYFSD